MMIIGHRGAKGLAPENTLAGIEKALEHGVDAVEIDVRITKDAVAVLAHDERAHDSAGNQLSINQSTYDQLLAHKPDIPTLGQAIELVRRRVPLIIEVKPGEATGPVVTVVRQYLQQGWRPADLPFISFDFQLLKQLHAALPAHPIIVDEMWSGVRATWRARRLGSKQISLYRLGLWSGFIRAVSRRGYQLYAFPLNDPAKAKRWAKAGLHGVITDFPDQFES